MDKWKEGEGSEESEGKGSKVEGREGECRTWKEEEGSKVEGRKEECF